jgi:hypothetical protein
MRMDLIKKMTDEDQDPQKRNDFSLPPPPQIIKRSTGTDEPIFGEAKRKERRWGLGVGGGGWDNRNENLNF